MPDTEQWYVFQIVTRVRANTEEDAVRLMYPALDTLQKLDAARLEPIVELLKTEAPFEPAVVLTTGQIGK